VGRITRLPSKAKAKPKFVHEVQVSRAEVDQPWLAELLDRIAGPNSYRKGTPFWAYTIFSFVHQEQADEMRLYVGRHREVAAKLEAKSRPCPVAIKYEEAALAQYAVIWGLSTGLMREVVRTYRRERRDCSTPGMPRAVSAEVITAAAPAIDVEKARKMVDAMLAWVIAGHGAWFWTNAAGAWWTNRGALSRGLPNWRAALLRDYCRVSATLA
jgi:hypothetical protein